MDVPAVAPSTRRLRLLRAGDEGGEAPEAAEVVDLTGEAPPVLPTPQRPLPGRLVSRKASPLLISARSTRTQASAAKRGKLAALDRLQRLKKGEADSRLEEGAPAADRAPALSAYWVVSALGCLPCRACMPAAGVTLQGRLSLPRLQSRAPARRARRAGSRRERREGMQQGSRRRSQRRSRRRGRRRRATWVTSLWRTGRRGTLRWSKCEGPPRRRLPGCPAATVVPWCLPAVHKPYAHPLARPVSRRGMTAGSKLGDDELYQLYCLLRLLRLLRALPQADSLSDTERSCVARALELELDLKQAWCGCWVCGQAWLGGGSPSHPGGPAGRLK